MTFAQRFLRDPALFPARVAGEGWGDETLAVEFAGGRYRIEGLDPGRRASMLERLAPFALPTPAGASFEGAVPCRVLRVAAEEFRAFDLRGWELSLDLDPRPEAVRIAGLDFMARLEWRPVLAAAVWTAADGAPFAGVVENVLRVLAAYRLLEAGGVLLHSAGIVDGGGAWLFCGRSGAGKSTLAAMSLAEGRGLLSDDLNAVLPGDTGPRVAPVPFAGDHRGTSLTAVPLAALCRLEQGSRTRLEPLGAAGALGSLLAAAPFVNQDPHRQERLLDVLEGLCAAVPTHRATVALAEPAWSAFAEAAAVA